MSNAFLGQPDTPGRVINSDPVLLSAGQTVTVPVPAEAIQLGYVLVQNGSPYTIQAAQGGLIMGQVAAFTAQVFRLTQAGQPVSFTSLTPSGIIVPTTDTNLYLTWYEQPPLGSWPATIGAGQVPYAVLELITGNVVDPGTGTYTSQLFTALGYGGIALHVSSVITGVLQATLIWYSDQAGTAEVDRQDFFVDANDGIPGHAFPGASCAFPNPGDYVKLVLNAPAGWSSNVRLELRQDAERWWSGGAVQLSSSPLLQSLALVQTHITSVAGNSTLSLRALFPFGGPCTFHVHWDFAASANTDWHATVNIDGQGTDVLEAGRWDALNDAGPSNLNTTLIVPPGVVVVTLANGTAAPHNVTAALIPDLSRAAA